MVNKISNNDLRNLCFSVDIFCNVNVATHPDCPTDSIIINCIILSVLSFICYKHEILTGVYSFNDLRELCFKYSIINSFQSNC